MNPSLLKLAENSQRPVAQIQPLAGVDIGKAVIVKPALVLIVVEHRLNNSSRDFPLAEFQAQFQAAVLASGQQPEGRCPGLVFLIILIFLFCHTDPFRIRIQNARLAANSIS